MLQVWIQNLCINEHMQGKAHSVYLTRSSYMSHLCSVFSVSSLHPEFALLQDVATLANV